MSVTPSMSVKFPVEKHVLKYLVKRYGSAHIATKKTLLGSLVLIALEKTYVKPDTRVENYFHYSVLIPEYYINVIGHSLPRNTQQHLGECCTKLFNMAMFEYVDNEVWTGKKALPTLKRFLNRYGITEDDMKFESLYRAYQRHCDDKIKQIADPELVAQLRPPEQAARKKGSKKPAVKAEVKPHPWNKTMGNLKNNYPK